MSGKQSFNGRIEKTNEGFRLYAHNRGLGSNSRKVRSIEHGFNIIVNEFGYWYDKCS